MLDDVKKFLAHPFSEDMTAVEWILFIGFVGIVAGGWRLVLAHTLGELK